MNRYAISFAIVVAGTTAAIVSATPQIGDKAPTIKAAKWVTGKPPALPGEPDANKHVFLVEFWATWCPPCLKSIPHMAQLHKKHEKDGLVVIGVSNEEPETIAAFIKAKQQMPYYVASDDGMATTTAWTKDVPAIPHAFIVDKANTVVWQGNPLADIDGMDKAIEQILAGKYDIEAAKQAAMTTKKMNQLMSELQPAYAAKDKEKAFKLLDQMIQLKPDDLHPYLIKQQMLHEFDMADRIPEWNAKILEAFKDSASAMRKLADFELHSDIADRDPVMLLRCALRANELAKGRDAETLEILARTQCALGMIDAAITTQTQAVALGSGETKERIRRVLDYYKTAQRLANEQRTGDK